MWHGSRVPREGRTQLGGCMDRGRGGAGGCAWPLPLPVAAGSVTGSPVGPCKRTGPGEFNCYEWGHRMTDDLWLQGHHPGKGIGHAGDM